MQHLLMGALPGSFNYGSLSETAASPHGPHTGSPDFGGANGAGNNKNTGGLARDSGSSAASEPSSLFANLPPATTGQVCVWNKVFGVSYS